MAEPRHPDRVIVGARIRRDLDDLDLTAEERRRLVLALLEDWRRHEEVVRAWTTTVLHLAETLGVVAPGGARPVAIAAIAKLDRSRAEELLDGRSDDWLKQFEAQLQACERLGAGAGDKARALLLRPKQLTRAQRLTLVAARCELQTISMAAEGTAAAAAGVPGAHVPRLRRARRTGDARGAGAGTRPTSRRRGARVRPAPSSAESGPDPREEEAGRSDAGPLSAATTEYLNAVRDLLTAVLHDELAPLQVAIGQLEDRSRSDLADVAARLRSAEERVAELTSLGDTLQEALRQTLTDREERDRREQQRERAWQEQEREWQDEKHTLRATVANLGGQVRRLEARVATEQPAPSENDTFGRWNKTLLEPESVGVPASGGYGRTSGGSRPSPTRQRQRADRPGGSGYPGGAGVSGGPPPRSAAGGGGTGTRERQSAQPARPAAAERRHHNVGVIVLNAVALTALAASTVQLVHAAGQTGTPGADNGPLALMFCAAAAYLLLASLIGLWPKRHRFAFGLAHLLLFALLLLVTVVPLSGGAQYPYASIDVTSTPYDGGEFVPLQVAAEWIDAPRPLDAVAQSGQQSYEANQLVVADYQLTGYMRRLGGPSSGFNQFLQPLLASNAITVAGGSYVLADAEPTGNVKAWGDLYAEAAQDPTVPTALVMELFWQKTGYIPAAQRPHRIGDSLMWLLQLEQGAAGSCGTVSGTFLNFHNPAGYTKDISDVSQYGIPDQVLRRYECKT
ncbi:MAG: hypothetical protein ACXVXT_07370 [Blastococcus sp.]